MKKILTINIRECSMCMSCVEVYPEVFRENDCGFIEISILSTYSRRKIAEAIKYCPKNCIEWS